MLLLFYGILLLSVHQSTALFDQVTQIGDKMWGMLDKQNGTISEKNLRKFFKRYESIPPIHWLLAVPENDFMSGEESWMLDFRTTEQQTRAYFRLLNKDIDTNLLITNLDVRQIYQFLDWLSLGVDKFMFKPRFSRMLRPIPWALMFIRYDRDRNEKISGIEFDKLFSAWDRNGDGKVTPKEFAVFWQKGKYGKEADAIKFHKNLDFDGNGVIDDKDVDEIYEYIDKDGDGELSFREFCGIDSLVHWPFFPPWWLPSWL